MECLADELKVRVVNAEGEHVLRTKERNALINILISHWANVTHGYVTANVLELHTSQADASNNADTFSAIRSSNSLASAFSVSSSSFSSSRRSANSKSSAARSATPT